MNLRKDHYRNDDCCSRAREAVRLYLLTTRVPFRDKEKKAVLETLRHSVETRCDRPGCRSASGASVKSERARQSSLADGVRSLRRARPPGICGLCRCFSSSSLFMKQSSATRRPLSSRQRSRVARNSAGALRRIGARARRDVAPRLLSKPKM